jgi:hypothetical protein
MLSLLLITLVSVHASSKTAPPSYVVPKVEAHLQDVPLERVAEIQKTVDSFEVVEKHKIQKKTRLGAEKTRIESRFISDDGKSSGLDTSVMTTRPDGTREVKRTIKWLHPEDQKIVKTKAKATQAPDGSMTVKSQLKTEEHTNFRGVTAHVKESVRFESHKNAEGVSSSKSSSSYQLQAPTHKELNMTMKEHIEFKDESKPGTYQESRHGKTKTFTVAPMGEK